MTCLELRVNMQVLVGMVLYRKSKICHCMPQILTWPMSYFHNILLRVREVPGSIPSQGPRHTKDVIKMVPERVPLFSAEHSKGKILALSQELR